VFINPTLSITASNLCDLALGRRAELLCRRQDWNWQSGLDHLVSNECRYGATVSFVSKMTPYQFSGGETRSFALRATVINSIDLVLTTKDSVEWTALSNERASGSITPAFLIWLTFTNIITSTTRDLLLSCECESWHRWIQDLSTDPGA
jgi:hypothetical protein